MYGIESYVKGREGKRREEMIRKGKEKEKVRQGSVGNRSISKCGKNYSERNS